MREAPSIDLIRALTSAGAVVNVHDPVAGAVARILFADLIQEKKLQISRDAIEAATDADALVLVTEWSEYRSVNFSALKLALKSPLILDGRNHLPIEDLKALGFTYVGVGR
jgi:UDPglucose 6-dehydrogenase